MPLPPRRSARQLFDDAARQLLGGVGEPARYVAIDGTEIPVLAALDKNAVGVGQDFGVTVVGRPAIDLLTAEVPSPEQGDRVIFPDSEWIVDVKDTDDGHIVRVWVSEP